MRHADPGRSREDGLMGSLRQRLRQPEVMDQPDLDPGRHAHALAGLARLNFFSRSSGILFAPLVEMQRNRRLPRLSILDVASGGGDVPIRLWRGAHRSGLDWRIAGVDVSPVAVEQAQARARRENAPIDFFVHDALAQPLPGGYDAVVCSLFLHHLDDVDAVKLLAAMAAVASGLVLVNDLDRTWSGLLLVHLAARLLTTSDVVHTDGPLSIKAAFTPVEALTLAEKAGLRGAMVSRRWPCRWLMRWSHPA
jgi:2-polyprenyl-3-methyl-5-hydroxy-6-metoxy-1,4-benzoquinol methylase